MNYLTDTTLLERRQDLRDHVWVHGPEHFNMEHWFARNGEGAFSGAAELNSCGTTACLGGHGTVILLQHNELSEMYEVGEHFGLPQDVFFMYWYTIRIGDETMADVFCRHAGVTVFDDARMGEFPLAEWSTVLDYLDWLVKSEIEAT